jgi:hypothetical protein
MRTTTFESVPLRPAGAEQSTVIALVGPELAVFRLTVQSIEPSRDTSPTLKLVLVKESGPSSSSTNFASPRS